MPLLDKKGENRQLRVKPVLYMWSVELYFLDQFLFLAFD